MVNHDKIRISLSAFIDGELSDNLRDEISQHLQSCDDCREELKDLDTIDSLVRGLPEISASENFASEIIARSRAVKSSRLWELNLPRRILNRVFLIAESIFTPFPGLKSHETGSLDEFGDFPPLSLSHAYFSVIGQPK